MMTHKRPVPAGSVSPYPLHPEPIQKTDVSEVADGQSNTGESWLPLVAILAVGIGSAAIVTALMASRRA